MFRIRQLGLCLALLLCLSPCRAQEETTTSAEDKASGDSTELGATVSTQSVGLTDQGSSEALSETGQSSTEAQNTSNGEVTATPTEGQPASESGSDQTDQTKPPTSETAGETSPDGEDVISDTDTTEGVETTEKPQVTEGSKVTERAIETTEGPQEETRTTATIQVSSGNGQSSEDAQTSATAVPTESVASSNGEATEKVTEGDVSVAASTVAMETGTHNSSSVGDAITHSTDNDENTTGEDSTSDQTDVDVALSTPSSTSSASDTVETTEALPEKVNKTFTLTFDGDCSLVTENAENRAAFTEYLRTLLKNIRQNNEIYITGIDCGSIKVTVVVSDVDSDEDVKKDIDNGMDSEISIQLQNGNDTEEFIFALSDIQEVLPPEEDVTPGPVEKAKELTDIEMILIIVFGVIGCGIVLFVFIACVNACHQKRMTKSFELGSTPHTDALHDDFSLTKMDRPKSNYDIERRPYGQGRQDLYAYQSSTPENIHEAETLQLPSRNSKGHDNPGYAKDEAAPRNGKTKGEGATAF